MAAAGRSLPRMIDIGANLTDPVFTGNYRGKQRHKDDFTTVLARAGAVGVDKIIVTAGSLSESKAALALVQAHTAPADQQTRIPQLFCTVGVHPTRCGEFENNSFGNDPDKYFAELVAACEAGAQDGKVVAIGECGLDYDRLEFCDRTTQLKYFEKQFQLTEATKLPMFLHNRNTGGDFYEMIAKNRARFSYGVVHSFTGETEEMLKLVELGLFIGVNGCSLKTAENLECVKAIPLDRLMIETDAPWCDIRATHASFAHVKTSWPSKKAERYEEGSLVKGRNEPCAIIQVLEVLSGIREEPLEKLADQIYENTRRVFFPQG